MRYKQTFYLIFFFLILAINIAFGAQIVVWGDQSSAPSGNDFTHIAAGGGVYGNHSLALKSNGSLVAWGYNGYGQCNVPTGNDFVDIAAGEFFSLALKSDDSLVAWGDNGNGQCNVPTGNNFVDIACGSRHALAIRSDGSLAAWGLNNAGQCNVPAGNNFVAVTGGMLHSLALKSDGSLSIWGSTSGWSQRLPSGNDFIAITAGAYYCLALKSDRSLVIWGLDSQGPDGKPWYVPDGNNFVAIAGGWQHCLALTSESTIVAWGSNSYGQTEPQTGDHFVAVACGDEHSLALNDKPYGIIYVDANATGDNNGSSWTNAYTFLQDALKSALSGDEIRIAKGIYKPDCNSANPNGDGNRSATFRLPDAVTIRGGYAGLSEPNPDLWDIKIYRTVLSGDLNGDDGPNFTNNDENSYHVTYCYMAKRTPILDGLTITGGNANGKSGIEPERYIQGGGLLCEKSNPLIMNCKITGNTAKGQYSYGGGISNYGASPKLINCVVSYNSAGRRGGGLYNNTNSKPKLVNCTLTRNTAGSGGSALACLNYSTANLTNCILWNSGTEIWESAVTNYCNVRGGSATGRQIS